MSEPEVSVVMAVRDVAATLGATVESVLAQEGVALELVVVDDGSTDETAELLSSHASRDSRVRALRQEPEGITTALRRGCAAARAPLIARQDAGDLSLPGRLRRQVEAFGRHPSLALVSCAAEIVAPEGERLWIERGGAPPDHPVALFGGVAGHEWVGPTAHGTAIFRKRDHDAVGGYREEFALGQDWDLWFRLGERGDFCALEAVLYRRRLDPDSLSLRYRGLQHVFGAASTAASRARRRGESEAPALARARELSARFARRTRGDGRGGDRAAGAYHVGEALRRAGHRSSLKYLGRAVRYAPWMGRAWVRLLQALPLAARARAAR